MPKSGNTSAGVTIRITVSEQSARVLAQIAALGIYGRNQSEVAARFVDKALQDFVEMPRIPIEPSQNRAPKDATAGRGNEKVSEKHDGGV